MEPPPCLICLKNRQSTSRPESNMLKNLPKMLPGISQKFHLPCLHYAPNLPKILSIVMKIECTDCSIRVFQYKVTVLLESIDLRSYVQTFTYYASIMLFIKLAYLMQAKYISSFMIFTKYSLFK